MSSHQSNARQPPDQPSRESVPNNGGGTQNSTQESIQNSNQDLFTVDPLALMSDHWVYMEEDHQVQEGHNSLSGAVSEGKQLQQRPDGSS